LNGYPENVYAAASQCLFDFLYRYYHGAHGALSQRPFFTSNNLAVGRDLFEQSGGFDAGMRFGEDREFCARVSAGGTVLHYAPRARVVHYRTVHARGFWKQHWHYGMGAYAYHQRARAYQRDTVLPEPVRFYAGMLSFPWQHARGARAAHLMSLVVMAQTANVCGFGYAALRSRRKVTQ
jgi:GT2 family glycosyltransferase